MAIGIFLVSVTDDGFERPADRARNSRAWNSGWPESIETPAGTVRITAGWGHCRVESNAGRYEFEWVRPLPRFQRRAIIVGTRLPDAVVTRAGVALWYPSRILRVRSDGIDWRLRRTGFLRRRITTADRRVVATYKGRALTLAAGLSPTEATLAVTCAASDINYWTLNTVEVFLLSLLNGL